MNRYKLESIMRMVRDKGSLPTDQWGAVLDGDDLLVWFGIDEFRTAFVRAELGAGVMAGPETRIKRVWFYMIY